MVNYFGGKAIEIIATINCFGEYFITGFTKWDSISIPILFTIATQS